MLYFVIPLFLVLYFEILGQSICDSFKIDRDIFNFLLGYAVVITVCYLSTSLLTALDCSFYLILVIYILFFIASLILIYKNRKDIDISFNLYYFLLLIVPLCIAMYFSLNTTLGELNGFDSTHYLNMVSGNIGLDKLNYSNVVFGDATKNLSNQYVFQSFYYFASVVLYVFSKIFSFLGIEFFYTQGYIWCFQTLFYFSLFGLIVNVLNRFFKNNYLAHISLMTLFTLSYGKLYFNSAFGFYGNTIRTVFVALSIYYLVEYFKRNDSKFKYGFSISILAACGSSSSAVFMIVFVYFALFFVEIDTNDNLFKEYIAVLFIPLINLLAILIGITKGISVTIFLVVVLFIMNDLLIKIIRNYKLKLPILLICIVIMVGLSLNITHNLFDFNAFFNNGSEIYDMTLDYFDLDIGYASTKMYKLISILSLILFLILNRKDKYAKIIFVLILVFFNPFCCSFLNKVNVVYYRAYELILNPSTVTIFFSMILSNLKNNRVAYYLCFGSIILCILQYGDISHPLYWHESFIPSDDYNKIYKMSNEELNIIREINSLSIYEDIDEPKIITPDLLTQSMIPSGIYIYGREYQINPNWSTSEKALYDIFWPVIHFGDARQPENPDYDNMCKYINDADIDFIVQPKATEYFDEEQNIWYSLTYKIDECGTYAFYDTDNYSVYRFES